MTIHERHDYNGAESLLAAQRDRILLVLNLKHTQTRSAEILGIYPKTLRTLQTRHRIYKRLGKFNSENVWK